MHDSSDSTNDDQGNDQRNDQQNDQQNDRRNGRVPAKTLREMLAPRMPVSAAATASACAFVLNRADGTVTMVRTSTNRVLPPIAVGEEPWGAVATPDGRRLYVSNPPSNSVSVLDVSRRAIVAAIGVGQAPQGLAVTPDGRRVYVANTDGDSISAIDTATNTVIGHPIVAGHTPWTLAITPDGRKAYVTNASANSVTAIDLATHTNVASIAVDKLPLAIVIAPDGRLAFVANAGSNTVTPIDLRSDTAGTAVAVGVFPCGVAITPDGRLLCVANSSSRSVTLIDVGGDSGGRGGSGGGGSGVSGVGSVGGVSGVSGASGVSSLAVVAHIDVGDTPAGVAIAADGRHAYVTLAGAHVMVAIDLVERRAISPSIPVGASPSGPAMGPPIVLPDAQQPAVAFSIEDDSDLTALGFGRFVPFDGGALKLAGPWHTNRSLSLLTHGGWIDTNGFDAIVEGDVINDGSLTKTGEGSLTLCGAIEHRKDTFVLEGTLIVESGHDAPVFVDGGVLGGTGRVRAVSVTNGAINPGGRRPGVLTADAVTFSPRASLIVDINGPVAGTDYDRLDVKVAATLNEATLIARFGAVLAQGTDLTILTNAQGTFANLPDGATVIAANGQELRITYTGGGGRDVVLTVL
jgi:YVTN family beta-propeller protein